MIASGTEGIVNPNPNLLNGMGGRIQGEALLKLLTQTLTTLDNDYAELKSMLDDELRDKAGEKAHQLKGSAYLFDCGEILFFLEKIAARNTEFVSTATFKNTFWERAMTCLGRLRVAIDECEATG